MQLRVVSVGFCELSGDAAELGIQQQPVAEALQSRELFTALRVSERGKVGFLVPAEESDGRVQIANRRKLVPECLTCAAGVQLAAALSGQWFRTARDEDGGDPAT